jgi:hypothetical protein
MGEIITYVLLKGIVPLTISYALIEINHKVLPILCHSQPNVTTLDAPAGLQPLLFCSQQRAITVPYT